MIVKKKGLCLGLLLSMLGIGNAMQAYKVTIKNTTPYKIKYQLDLPIGKDKHGRIGPKSSATIEIVGYSVRRVKATVYEKCDGKTVQIRAKEYYAKLWKAGGGTWIIVGPYSIKEDPDWRYQVTREVR